MWCGSPGNFSPVDVDIDRQILKEGVELGGVVIRHVEEPFECLDAGVLFLEELNDCLSFPLVGSGGVQQWGCGGSVPDMQLIVEEIGDFLVEGDEAVVGIE